jgi:IPT/TIG domain
LTTFEPEKIMKIIPLLSLIVLWLGCGYGSPKPPAPQAGVVPAITELSPDNATAGGKNFTLTVNGSNFNSNAVVNWNGTAQTTMLVTGKQLTAAIPASAIAAAGMAQVSVTNPGSPATGGPYGSGGTQSETSNVMTFTINN